MKKRTIIYFAMLIFISMTGVVHSSERGGPYIFVSVVNENGTIRYSKHVVQRMEKTPNVEALLKMPTTIDITGSKKIVIAGRNAILSNFEVTGGGVEEGFSSISVSGKGFFIASENDDVPIAGEFKVTRKKVRAIWNEDGGTDDVKDEYEAAWADIR